MGSGTVGYLIRCLVLAWTTTSTITFLLFSRLLCLLFSSDAHNSHSSSHRILVLAFRIPTINAVRTGSSEADLFSRAYNHFVSFQPGRRRGSARLSSRWLGSMHLTPPHMRVLNAWPVHGPQLQTMRSSFPPSPLSSRPSIQLFTSPNSVKLAVIHPDVYIQKSPYTFPIRFSNNKPHIYHFTVNQFIIRCP